MTADTPPRTGHIYVLSNPHMRGLVKIGFTLGPPESRALELSRATGVPGRYKVERSWLIQDPRRHERAVHRELRRYRVEGKELFKLTAPVAIERINVMLANWNLIDPGGLAPAADRCGGSCWSRGRGSRGRITAT
jgi:T5orf172 domain